MNINCYPSLIFLFSLLSVGRLSAQSTGVPLNSATYHILDRLDIMGKVKHNIHPEVKGVPREQVVALAIEYDSLQSEISKKDRADLQYLFDDNNEWVNHKVEDEANFDTQNMYKDNNGFFHGSEDNTASKPVIRYRENSRPLLKYFYRTPANFFEVNSKYFRAKVNPILNFGIGKAQNEDGYIFQNTRGLEVRGDVDGKLFFYTNLEENQVRYAAYAFRKMEENFAVPGTGAYKYYVSQFFDNNKAFDFTNAQAYIGVKATKHVGVQFGHGQNFIGNGYRSLFLSNNAANYFFLKLSANVWRFQYQSIFAELSPTSANYERFDQLLPKKYSASHYLNYKVRPNLTFGLFETVMFSRKDHFELQYLNPVILYRSVESVIGSPDNVMLGFDGKWNVLNHVQLYGQILLDEFNFDFLYKPDSTGWWANKYAVQAGLKYINAFNIDHLDIQLEYNKVRPFTYSHFDTVSNYTQFRQPLAHPIGSNFREMIAIVRYQPIPKLIIQARGLRINSGENNVGQNWGADPNLDNDTHIKEFGNTTGQGVGANINIVGVDVSWQLYHNMFLDLKYFKRQKSSDDATRNETTDYYGLGIRVNAWNVNSRTDF